MAESGPGSDFLYLAQDAGHTSSGYTWLTIVLSLLVDRGSSIVKSFFKKKNEKKMGLIQVSNELCSM